MIQLTDGVVIGEDARNELERENSVMNPQPTDDTSPPGRRRRTARRMGPQNSSAWHSILDGAEAILREEGHAMLNAKRIAERVGIKRPLVYYYFCDIDDLLVELFERISQRSLAQLRLAMESDMPLSLTWSACVDAFDQALILEFLALANRNAKVRKALLDYADVARGLQIGAISKAFSLHPPQFDIPPVALAHIATWIGLGLQREATLGMTQGHQAVLELIGRFLEASGESPSLSA
jgi:AcrR family transcriptional regulator